MKLYRLKIIFLHMIAFLAGYTSVFACYPFSISFFSASYICDRFRYTLFPMVILGMAVTGTVGQVLKYGIAMGVFLLVVNIFEKSGRKRSKWMQGAFAGASLFVVAWMFQENLLEAVMEGVLVASLTVIVAMLLESFLITSTTDEDSTVIHGPGKRKLRESAEVFERLAGCFGELPSKQTEFSNDDRDRMSRQMEEDFCTNCSKCLECWEKNYYDTMTTTSDLFAKMETEGIVTAEEVKGRMSVACIRLRAYLNEMQRVFERARTNLFWYNRLIENREAVAGQLVEMANMMTLVADDIYDVVETEDISLQDQITRMLKQHHVAVRKITVSKKKDGKRELYITMYAKGNRCISTREIGRRISAVTEIPMVPHKDSRRVLNYQTDTVCFVQDTAFRVLHGVAKAIKPGQQVSGDNFTFLETDDGQAVACISDGMGSGVKACRESEVVIELLERFLEAGFCKETALKMINSTMVLTDGEPNCSTIDVCAVDLYEGVCEFLKLGAAATYIKRDHWVEIVQSTSLPVGVLHRVQYDSCSKKLFDGDFVVMVSDGVIEALGEKDIDAKMESLLLKLDGVNPKETANKLLSEVLARCNYCPADDITILVFGIWKK